MAKVEKLYLLTGIDDEDVVVVENAIAGVHKSQYKPHTVIHFSGGKCVNVKESTKTIMIEMSRSCGDIIDLRGE